MIQITGIGSLPHHNVDAALEYAFRFDVPFLPQIPIRNHAEYMIPQALEGLPGLVADEGGAVALDAGPWRAGRGAFERRMADALEGRASLPLSPQSMACWHPFLFELAERKVPFAKVQIAGPLTCQWVLQGNQATGDPEVSADVVRIITAKCLSMVAELKARGVQPLIVLDEPGLYAYTGDVSAHKLAFQDLRLLVMALRKMGALVGLHCCSDTDWRQVLGLGLNMISFDVALSGKGLFSCRDEVSRFVEEGGRFILGIVATNRGVAGQSAEVLVNDLERLVCESMPDRGVAQRQILKHSLLSPACGLALKTPEECEMILGVLRRIQGMMSAP